MPRITHTDYRRQMIVLMCVYVATMLLLWPHARTASSLPLKIGCALLPTLPILGLLWLMAKRVMRSDELEQRVHLVALSVATGIVCALSLLAGFLCAAGIVVLDGDILIWIFPALCASYGATRWLLARRYGAVGCE